MLIPLANGAASIGAGVILIGASLGISLLWSTGLKSIARQPEIQAKLQTTMIIGAAFIEGAALFALVICLMKG